jgi:hypothetical protein
MPFEGGYANERPLQGATSSPLQGMTLCFPGWRKFFFLLASSLSPSNALFFCKMSCAHKLKMELVFVLSTFASSTSAFDMGIMRVPLVAGAASPLLSSQLCLR